MTLPQQDAAWLYRLCEIANEATEEPRTTTETPADVLRDDEADNVALRNGFLRGEGMGGRGMNPKYCAGCGKRTRLRFRELFCTLRCAAVHASILVFAGSPDFLCGECGIGQNCHCTCDTPDA